MTLFSRVGIPEEILTDQVLTDQVLTDQGSNFTSTLLTEMLHVHPNSMYTQTDGLVERFNRSNKGWRKRLGQSNPICISWSTTMAFLHSSYCMAEVFPKCSRYRPRSLADWQMRKCEHNLLQHNHRSFKTDSKDQIQKTWYDQNSRQREFHEGDQVLVLLPTSSNKLLGKKWSNQLARWTTWSTCTIDEKKEEYSTLTCWNSGMYPPLYSRRNSSWLDIPTWTDYLDRLWWR